MESIYLKVENKNGRTTKIDKSDILALIKETETITSMALERNRNEVYLPMKADEGERLNRNNELGMAMAPPREGSAVMSSLNHSSSDGMEGEEVETKPPGEALSSGQPPARKEIKVLVQSEDELKREQSADTKSEDIKSTTAKLPQGQSSTKLKDEDIERMLIESKVSKKEKEEVKNLVREYEDRFMEGLETAGMVKYIPH